MSVWKFLVAFFAAGGLWVLGFVMVLSVIFQIAPDITGYAVFIALAAILSAGGLAIAQRMKKSPWRLGVRWGVVLAPPLATVVVSVGYFILIFMLTGSRGY